MTMKLLHPTLRSVKSVTSLGPYEIDKDGNVNVGDELGELLLTCGFKRVVSEEPAPPVKPATPPAVIVPPAPEVTETAPVAHADSPEVVPDSAPTPEETVSSAAPTPPEAPKAKSKKK